MTRNKNKMERNRKTLKKSLLRGERAFYFIKNAPLWMRTRAHFLRNGDSNSDRIIIVFMGVVKYNNIIEYYVFRKISQQRGGYG